MKARPGGGIEQRERRLAWMLVSPALAAVALAGLFPLGWTAWESLHRHDLRTPWLGRPFIGLENYVEAFADPRFHAAVAHTAAFTAITVILELTLGLVLALALNASFRGRGLLRASVLVPWAMPTVVTALLFRFLFETPAAGGTTWFADPLKAWIPLILADVWKTTPFVALLLLAGLQGIDSSVYEAARIDGATAWRRFTRITLPLLRPALLVALVFRSLDALRVFDLVYVLTGGGPGTATEPVALYAFTSLLRNLRFGFGSAVSVVIFAFAAVLAILYVRLLEDRTGSPQ